MRRDLQPNKLFNDYLRISRHDDAIIKMHLTTKKNKDDRNIAQGKSFFASFYLILSGAQNIYFRFFFLVFVLTNSKIKI